MTNGTDSPPGLEALASHLGYTFIKKDGASENDSSPATDDKADKPEEEKEDKPQVPKGSLNTFGKIYWVEDDETWTAKEPDDTKPAEGEETEGHAVLLRQKKSADSRKKYEIDSLIIQSPQLKTALGEILNDYPGVCCNLDRLVFEGPFEPLVHRWGALLEYMKKDGLDKVTKDHLELLHEILSKELADTIKAFDDYVSNGVVTYEHAWIIFQPGAVVVAPGGPGGNIAIRFKSGSYMTTQEDGNYYRLSCERVDWNGKAFGWAEEYVRLMEFKGVQPIAEMNVFPLSFHPTKETVKLSLIERGKKWSQLAGVRYRSYDGPAVLRTSEGNVLVQTKGRIIVDADTFCKQWDQCKIYVTPLDSGSSDKHERVENWENPVSNDNTELSLNEPRASTNQELTDYQYMLCSPLLRGYSMKTKKWMSFYIPHVKDIKWDNRAFDSLVLPASQKKIVLALSKAHVTGANSFDDVIAGKGKGMILLLSGPPGVGKTLTAEAVSEKLQVPLFMMSAGDLGVRADEVEVNLERVLEMVAKWKAILLIDECDVFLEARSAHDLDRNKLVSIFLRLLEYYQGTLFMTTNRVDNIDPAFQSRIHVHMEYKDLTTTSRKSVWRSFLDKLPSNFSDDEVEEIASVNLNGRQIKNVVKTAQLLALDEQQVLSKEYIDIVMALERGFKYDGAN
ncbi:P-loop containing nucleoside triphosphate hydrolase protein [Clohesyomyces aquaticus]|uniref:p-loop containing nucleoside triphosphate hydrolase protein n=1 Tax=Clohesyomyces aquaticus TaxID=1231657 RepID=A0A1Y1YUU0_9PLEO|nr:P-loop containing nucleoside triphosphate hydrolase protein [Clohesyomyces aquaticus]